LRTEAGHYKKAAVIFNPYAGRLLQGARSLQRTIQVLEKQGIEAELFPTEGPNTAARIARTAIASGCDLILAAGGDGTINEVANGMVFSQVPLAILPGGTANVLAHELGVKIHIEQTAAGISDAVPTRIAVGCLTDGNGAKRYFLLMAGIGLDAQIVYDMNLDLKAFAGKLAYYFGGFSQVMKPLVPFRAVVDGKEHTTTFALVTRVRNYGGDFEIAREASLLRDQFEVVLFDAKRSFQYLPYLAGMMFGQVAKMKGCTMLRARLIRCEPIDPECAPLQIDGEFAGRIPVSLEIVPHSLTLLLPPQFVERERVFQQAATFA
jgi:diacylglycerol kinase (ATP)